MNECIYILLPVHNRIEITRRFIECLQAQTYKKYHLVLIDDGSSDSTEEMVRSYITSMTVIKGKGNWWWGGSLQKGYDWLKSVNAPQSDIILIINDDSEIKPDFLEKGLNLLRGFNNTLLLAQCYSRYTGKLIDAGVHVDWKNFSFEQASEPAQINCLSTRGLFLRVGDFFNIGGFYPRLLPHYASDYEFSIRAHRKGFKLVTIPSLSLVTDEKATGCHNVGSESILIILKKLFSKRTVENPLMWSAFILLACPWRYKIVNLYKEWRSTLMLILTSSSFKSKKEMRNKG